MSQGETLTPKQAMFAGLVASGKSLTESYLSAYNWKGKNRSGARLEASKLLKNPKVKNRIDQLKADSVIAKKTQEEISKRWILEKLRTEATDDDNSSSVRVRALEILAKSEGLFSDSTSVTIETRSSDEIEKDLKEKLRNLFGNGADSTLLN